VLADLDRLDERIVEHLGTRRPSSAGDRARSEGDARPTVRRDHVRHLRRH
jgi:hypothetical protein